MSKQIRRTRAKNRSKVRIVRDILALLDAGALSKTHIMYKANLSYDQNTAYLDFLVGNGLIEKEPTISIHGDDARRRALCYYILTPKGQQALERLRGFEELLGAGPETSAELFA